jgi:hypothetical protein
MTRKFAVTTMDDLKGKLKSAWISYYNLSEEAQSEKDVFIYLLEHGQVGLEKVKAFTLIENRIYLDALLEDIKVTFS